MSAPEPLPDLTGLDVGELLAQIEEASRNTIPSLAVMLSPDVDGMIQLLQGLRRAMAQLRWAADDLEDEIVKAMPSKTAEVPGVGLCEMRTGTKRTAWDKDGLVAALTARIADDPLILCEEQTGEMLPPAQQVERILSRFLEAATPSWKVTGLRGSFHLDPDEFCTTAYGRKTVQTPTPEAFPAAVLDEAEPA